MNNTSAFSNGTPTDEDDAIRQIEPLDGVVWAPGRPHGRGSDPNPWVVWASGDACALSNNGPTVIIDRETGERWVLVWYRMKEET